MHRFDPLPPERFAGTVVPSLREGEPDVLTAELHHPGDTVVIAGDQPGIPTLRPFGGQHATGVIKIGIDARAPLGHTGHPLYVYPVTERSSSVVAETAARIAEEDPHGGFLLVGGRPGGYSEGSLSITGLTHVSPRVSFGIIGRQGYSNLSWHHENGAPMVPGQSPLSEGGHVRDLHLVLACDSRGLVVEHRADVPTIVEAPATPAHRAFLAERQRPTTTPPRTRLGRAFGALTLGIRLGHKG